jgi:hypothetical protein
VVNWLSINANQHGNVDNEQESPAGMHAVCHFMWAARGSRIDRSKIEPRVVRDVRCQRGKPAAAVRVLLCLTLAWMGGRARG